ncbi:hypothetical protein BDZ91DRAFT_752180 [Kalaharituber pfeilii]|nr:hypothetical protein BDZ91DRAFT_752180 [Kalaharituber pfeilii]
MSVPICSDSAPIAQQELPTKRTHPPSTEPPTQKPQKPIPVPMPTIQISQGPLTQIPPPHTAGSGAPSPIPGSPVMGSPGQQQQHQGYPPQRQEQHQGYPPQGQQWYTPPQQQQPWGQPPPQQQQLWGQPPPQQQQPWGQPPPQQQQQWGQPQQVYQQYPSQQQHQQHGHYPPPQSSYPTSPIQGYQQFPQSYPPVQGYPPPAGYPSQPSPQLGPYAFPPQAGAPYAYPHQIPYLNVAPGAVGWQPSPDIPYIPPTVGYSLHPFDLNQYPQYPPIQVLQDVELLTKAFSSSLNTDEKAIIKALSNRFHPLDIAARRQGYRQTHVGDKKNPSDLLDIVRNRKMNFSGGFKSLVYALVAGPLDLDVNILSKAIDGPGTNEDYIGMALLSRNNEDIKAICAQWENTRKSNDSLLKALESDLSGRMAVLYKEILKAERRWEDPNIPIPHAQIEENINELYAALTGTPDFEKVMKYFTKASFYRLRCINKEWKRVTAQSESLESRIKSKFTQDTENALIYILRHATDKAKLDARLIEASINSHALIGKEEVIAFRLIKLLWEDMWRVGSLKEWGLNGATYAPGDYLKEVNDAYFGLFSPSGGTGKTGYLWSRIEGQIKGNKHFYNLVKSMWESRR